jgi:hypothetical protein
MVVWEGGTQKGGFGGGTLVARRHPCLLAPRYRQPSAGVNAEVALAGAQSDTADGRHAEPPTSECGPSASPVGRPLDI